MIGGGRGVRPHRGLRELRDAGIGEGLLHLGIGVELSCLLAQDEVGAHASASEVPDALARLIAVGAGIEVLGTGISRVLQQADKEEVVLDSLGAEAQVLVKATDLLVVEVDVEELALPQRLRDTLIETQARHRLVGDLGVEPDHLGVVQGLNEGQCVAHGRQEGVAAGLIGLGLDGEADVVALVLDVAREEVQCLAVALECVLRLLGCGRFHTFASTPEDVRRRAELGGNVEIAHRLRDRVAAYISIVGCEGAILEERVPEEIGRRHRADDPGLIERLLEAIELSAALRFRRTEGHEVVVVEAHTPGADVGEALDVIDRVDRGTRGVAEGIASRMPDGPHAEGEAVLRGRGVVSHAVPLLKRGRAPGNCCQREHMAGM